MASVDWADFSDGHDSNTVARGVTAGVTPPNAGGSFIFGFHSLIGTPGGTAKYVNKTNFNPLKNTSGGATGGSIRGALQRGVSSTPETSFAPALFINLKSGLSATPPSVNDVGYLLGLEDSNPHRIVLRKGSIAGGLTVDTTKSTLRVSAAAFNPGTWVHLRLDAIFNQNGDVVLKVFQSDLVVNPVTTPNWVAVSSMADFIDDVLQVNSGSTPLNGGFIGFGFFSKDVQKRGYVDHIEVLRQL